MAERKLFLRITTWTGCTPLASHFYGSLHDANGNPVRVSRHGHEFTKRLGKVVAQRLNERDGVSIWRWNSRTTRFESRDELLQVACDWFYKHAPEGTVLLVGSAWSPRAATILARKRLVTKSS